MALFIRNKKQSELSGIRNMTDEQLIACYKRSNDKQCVEELFNRYTHLVFAVSMKYVEDEETAKDIVMDIFEDLFELLYKHEVANFKSWLHTVTRNFCLMRIRREKTARNNINRVIAENEDNFVENIDEEHLHEEEDLKNKLHTAMEQLSKEQKKCLEMMYLDDKSYKEIADITGFSLNQVKSYIQNGKRNLKLLMI